MYKSGICDVFCLFPICLNEKYDDAHGVYTENAMFLSARG